MSFHDGFRYYGIEVSERTLLPGDDAAWRDALRNLAHAGRRASDGGYPLVDLSKRGRVA